MKKENVYLVEKNDEEIGEMTLSEILSKVKMTSGLIDALKNISINEHIYYNDFKLKFKRIY